MMQREGNQRIGPALPLGRMVERLARPKTETSRRVEFEGCSFF